MRAFLPNDSTYEEREIVDWAAISLYRKLPDDRDKFIVAMAFDMGYGPEKTAEALGISYTAVYKRVQKIKKCLKEKKTPVEVKV